MKLQIVSDLHLEFNKDATFTGMEPAPDADALIIAGDIHVHVQAVERFRDWPVPVIYVTGNHEFYAGGDMDEIVLALRRACAGTAIRFLEKDVLVLPGFPEVRFLGTCLWTDYLLFGTARQAACMRECLEDMVDHRKIHHAGRGFMPDDAAKVHVASRNWLAGQLAVPFDGRTVVVTHHGCHWESVAPRWREDLSSAGFASDLTPLIDRSDLWVHGHTHDSLRYMHGRCEVVVNPRGYPLKAGGYENPTFDPSLVVHI